MPFVSPPLLPPGSRVALVAPAGPLRDSGELDQAIANVRLFGWEPVTGSHVLERRGYLAGTDVQRATDLNGAIRDPAVDGIWCVRGGYGVLRLLDRLDFEAMRQRPKALIGFSDVTAVHAAVNALAGVVTFHGPTARAPLGAFSRDSLANAVVHGLVSTQRASEAEVLVPGAARGRLAGGNLALLSSLVGTPYFPVLAGAILVLEDVNEPVYRIDRMLRHLRLSGAMSRLAGLVFGAFTERGEERDSLPLDEVLRETAEAVGVPCLSGVPVGHLDEQWTLPLGAVAALDATDRSLTIDPLAHA